MTSSNRRYRRGFTIVELLTALSIIAVLAALLLPVLSAARNSARRGACLSNLRQLGAATLIYAENWDSQLLETPAGATAVSGGLRGAGVSLPQVFRQWREASSSTYFRLKLTNGPQKTAPDLFRCPNDSGAPSFEFYGSSVYDASGTSYLWDPGASTEILGTPELTSVSGLSLDDLEDPASARLLQDYGATWHRQGRSTGFSVRTAARVNVVFADGHAGLADVNQATVSLSSPSLTAGRPGASVYSLAAVRK